MKQLPKFISHKKFVSNFKNSKYLHSKDIFIELFAKSFVHRERV